MHEQPKYFEDQIDSCPFCGKVYPGEQVVVYEEWWYPTECSHVCCQQCAVRIGDYALCPRCVQEELLGNGKHV